MTDKQDGVTGDTEAGDLRGKLVKRLAVAGVLVALLLGILAVFDYLASTPDEAESPVYSQPVPVAPRKEVSRPVTPAENLPEPPAPEPAPAPPEPPPVAASSVMPEPPAEKSEKRPAGPLTANIAKSPVASPIAPRPYAVPEAPATSVQKAERPGAAPIGELAVGKPQARVVEPQPAVPPAQPSGIARLFSGFVLQAGVFTSAQRAEELHAKLTLSGVPSTLETRVQVGPFRTRQEAEAAQAKLRELGVETILVPPKSGRHQ